MNSFNFFSKKGLVFTFLIFSSLTFFSCQSDPVVSTDNSQLYEWRVESVTLDSAISVSVSDANNSFAAKFSDEANGYRITEGVVSEINFLDTNFSIIDLKSLDINYAVFAGYRRFISSASMLKIYDNGVIRAVNLEPYANDALIGVICISSKDNFFFANLHNPVIYHYLNGTTVQYILPESIEIQKITKLNGNIYAFGLNQTNNLSSVYKFTESGFTKLTADFGPNWNIFPMENDIIKIISHSNKWDFFYFTEQGWITLGSYIPGSNVEYTWYLSGKSKDQFVAISRNDSTNLLNATAWNGKEFAKQKNFPVISHPFNSFPFYKKSEYKDNTVVLYYTDNGGKFLKGKYKGL